MIVADGTTARTIHITGGTYTTPRVFRRAAGVRAFSRSRPGARRSSLPPTTGQIWEETGGQGVDDVCAVDLDGDGVDEVIVGYNGMTGLHVFSAEGERLWKRTDLGNVWHVSAGDMDGDRGVDVVSTSAQGKVHITSAADGKDLRTLDPGLYANMIRTAPGRSIPGLKGDLILVVGTAEQGGVLMVALGGDGKTIWTLDFPAGTQACDSLAVSPNGAWAAVGLRGGRVCVVDLARGRVVAHVSGQGGMPATGWVDREDRATPLLLVATGRVLNAYRVVAARAPRENNRP